jgi:hypothetical protein
MEGNGKWVNFGKNVRQILDAVIHNNLAVFYNENLINL